MPLNKETNQYFPIEISMIFCTELDSFQHSIWLKIFIWSIDGNQTGSTTLDQSGPGSSGNEGVLYIPQSSRVRAS